MWLIIALESCFYLVQRVTLLSFAFVALKGPLEVEAIIIEA